MKADLQIWRKEEEFVVNVEVMRNEVMRTVVLIYGKHRMFLTPEDAAALGQRIMHEGAALMQQQAAPGTKFGGPGTEYKAVDGVVEVHHADDK